MKVKETLKAELDALMQDLVAKIDTTSPFLSVNEVFDLARAQGVFNPNKYIYSEDEATLLDMLTYSLGLSKLYEEYLKENPEAGIECVNGLIIEFMKRMWGLEKVQTLAGGVNVHLDKWTLGTKN